MSGTGNEVRALLALMRLEDLQNFADWRDLVVGGSKAQLVDRIAEDATLRSLVSADGSPWMVGEWNDLLEQKLNRPRRRAWDAILTEVKIGLAALHRREKARGLGNPKLSDVLKSEDLLRRFAELLVTNPGRLRKALQMWEGRCLIDGVWDDLEAELGPKGPSASMETGVATGPAVQFPPASAPAADTDNGTRLRTEFLSRSGSPREGDVLSDKWTIVRRLGRGGMGVAYEVRSATGEIRVAKFALGTPADREILRNEHEKHRDLDHPHIVRQYGGIRTDARHGEYLILQHGGESLEDWFVTHDATVKDIAHVVEAVALALDYAHASAGIVHGDVSPSNILIDQTRHVRLSDFGVAARLSGSGGVTTLRGGKEYFMAPEAGTKRGVTKSSDQYSLARVAIFVAGRGDPVVGEQILWRHPGVRSAIQRATSTNPTERFECCRELAQAFRRAVG